MKAPFPHDPPLIGSPDELSPGANDVAQQMRWATEFSDLASRAAAIGDYLGARRYAAYARIHLHEVEHDFTRWRDQINQSRGGRDG